MLLIFIKRVLAAIPVLIIVASLTFFFVSIAFVLMRSDNYEQFHLFLNSLIFGKIFVYSSLNFFQTFLIDNHWTVIGNNINFSSNVIQIFNTSSYLSIFVLALIAICKYAPNSNEIVEESILEDGLNLKKKYPVNIKKKAFLTGVLLAISSIALTFNDNNFIYFQF